SRGGTRFGGRGRRCADGAGRGRRRLVAAGRFTADHLPAPVTEVGGGVVHEGAAAPEGGRRGARAAAGGADYWATAAGVKGGANGTRNWDLSLIADSDAVFPQLRALSIEQTKPGDHNRSIVAAVYEEEGILARILARAPVLESLVTPSAPNADFFRVGERPLA